MIREFYTYLHCRPDGTPFYVGKGYGTRARDLHHRSTHHKRIVAKHGIAVFVFPCASEPQAIADEIQQIAQLRAEGISLCNQTDGGDGISGLKHSEETKAKITAAALGRVQPLETRFKISAAKRNLTDLTRAKISAAKVGKKRPPFSAEHLGRLAAAAVGNKRGLGNKSTTGRKASEETRAKMAASHRKKWLERKSLTSPKR